MRIDEATKHYDEAKEMQIAPHGAFLARVLLPEVKLNGI